MLEGDADSSSDAPNNSFNPTPRREAITFMGLSWIRISAFISTVKVLAAPFVLTPFSRDSPNSGHR